MRGIDLVLGLLLMVSGVIAGFSPGQSLAIGEDGRLTAEGVEGESRFVDTKINGVMRVGSSRGAFALEGPIELQWQLDKLRMDVHSFKRTGGYAGAGYQVTVTVNQQEPTVTEHYENATVALAGESEGLVVVWPDVEENAWFELGLVPDKMLPLHGSAYGTTFESEDDHYRYWMPGPVFGFGHNGSQYRVADAMDVQFDRFNAIGAVKVLVHHSLITVIGDDREDSYWTGHEATTFETVPVPGQRVTYAVLTIPMADLTIENFRGLWSTFFVSEPLLDVEGLVSFTAEDGEVKWEDTYTEVDGDSVQMEGNVTLDLAAEGDSDGTEHSQGSWGILPVVLPDPEIFGSFEAEPEGFTINGRKPFDVAPQRARSPTVLQEDVSLFSKIAGAVLLAWAIGWRAVPFLLSLSQRDPLDNPRRRQIRDYLEKVGVAHCREIHRHLGIAIGSVVYHLEILRRSGIVSGVRAANYQAYFLCAPGRSREQMQQLALLADVTRRDIAKLVARESPISQEDLVRLLGKTQSAISRQLCKLVTAGLVRKEKNEKQWYSPSDVLKDWFEGS